MKENHVNWTNIIVVATIILIIVDAILAMRCAGFGFSTELGIYKATGWHATVGEIANGVVHPDYQTHLDIFDIIRLWNV